jgi:hypothetical protein
MKKIKKLHDEHKVLKGVITGNTIPKSVGLIELEENYALVADLLVHLIDKMQQLERDVEKLEKKVSHLLAKK